ncbi:MAG: NUDIX domain-containing protein [Candidatus Paceibacterota bacterium]|jgi:ADP-ribose pyrophosphatase YjhB (NUDIX family)
MDNPDNIPEFGTKRENEERRDGGCGIVFDPLSQRYAVGLQENGLFRIFSGGVDPDEDMKEGVTREVIEESGLHNFLQIEKLGEVFAHYHNTLRNVNRVTKSTFFLFILENAELIPVQLEEHEKFHLVWVNAEELENNWKERNEDGDLDHWFYFLEKAVVLAKELGYDKTSKDIKFLR